MAALEGGVILKQKQRVWRKCTQEGSIPNGLWTDSIFVLFIFFFWMSLWHVAVPRPGIQPEPQRTAVTTPDPLTAR